MVNLRHVVRRAIDYSLGPCSQGSFAQGVDQNNLVHTLHNLRQTLTRLPRPTFARSKERLSAPGQDMKSHRPPQPKTGGPCRMLHLDKGMGNQAQAEEMAQFMELERVEWAQVARGGSLSTSKDRDTFLTHLSVKSACDLLAQTGLCSEGNYVQLPAKFIHVPCMLCCELISLICSTVGGSSSLETQQFQTLDLRKHPLACPYHLANRPSSGLWKISPDRTCTARDPASSAAPCAAACCDCSEVRGPRGPFW